MDNSEIKNNYSRSSNNSRDLNNLSISKLKVYISTKPRMTYEEILWEFRIGKEYRDDQRIIDANLPLVFSIVGKLYNKHRYLSNNEFKTCDVQFIDLFQAGVLGLVKAIEKYDSTRNTKFSAYAYNWIAQKIREEIRKTIYPLKTYQYAPVNIVELKEKHSGIDSRFYDVIDYKELLEDIRGILSANELVYFELYFIKEHSISEISKIVNRCTSTSRYHIKNIKAKLQKELKRNS